MCRGDSCRLGAACVSETNGGESKGRGELCAEVGIGASLDQEVDDVRLARHHSEDQERVAILVLFVHVQVSSRLAVSLCGEDREQRTAHSCWRRSSKRGISWNLLLQLLRKSLAILHRAARGMKSGMRSRDEEE